MNISSNFFEIVTSKNTIQVPYLNFEEDSRKASLEKLKAFRENNPASIFTHSGRRIFFWGDNALSEDGLEKIPKNNSLFSKIMAESFLHQFYQNRDKFSIKKKFHTYRITLMDQEILVNRFKGLKLYKTFHLHFASLLVGNKMKLGFTISYSISERICWKIQDFKNAGLQYEDLKYDEARGTVFINSKSKYRLAHHFNYSSQLKNEIDKQNSIQNEFKEINEFVKRYFEHYLSEFNLPNNLRLNSISKITTKLNKQHGGIENKILQKPECYFYNSRFPKGDRKYHNRLKISYNKPFTYDEFENKKISITLIFPKDVYSDIGNFWVIVQKELTTTFKLRKDLFEYNKIEIDNFELTSYQEKLSLVKDADLVIVVVDKSHEILSPHESPYYFCKAEFIKRGINTQEVQIQQVRKFLEDKNNNSTNYSDHNIALNIYAKLGGMAWTIKPNQPRNELVIGIGATTDRNGQPVLGLTSIFRGDGKYLFGKVSSVTNMENYKNGLEKIISSAIENSIDDGTLDTNQPFYLIFHIFKPAGKDNEIKALEKVINRFSKYSFQYAFVHMGRGHNYRFFMYKGIEQKPQFEMKRGFGQNTRGTFIKINDKRAFLSLQSNNSVFYKIDIHQNSTFIDLEYLAEQIYQFTEISHTSYNQQGIPVTIKYPNLMARFAEKFNEGNLMYLNEVTMPDTSLWFI